MVARDRDDLVEARTRIEAALDIIESLRTKIASQELRASYFASAQQYFETYIDLLMQLHNRQPNGGHDGRALQASERARARSLLEMLTEAAAHIREGVDPDLLERERTVQQPWRSSWATLLPAIPLQARWHSGSATGYPAVAQGDLLPRTLRHQGGGRSASDRLGGDASQRP